MSNEMAAMTAGKTPGGGRAAIECRGVWYRANGGGPPGARPDLRNERGETRVLLCGSGSWETAARKPREIPGAQRKRVGVARALAADPPILLMDEPFGALDPVTRAELQGEFRRLAQRLGKTIVFVTHDVREALLLGTRIALLAEGKLVAVRVPAEFLHSPEPEVQAFVSSLQAPGGAGAH